jgi:integrase
VNAVALGIVKTPLEIVRKLYPRVRVRVKGNTTSYEVDCRSVQWKGQPYFSYGSKADALKQAAEVAKLVNEHGKAGIKPDDIRLLERLRLKLLPYEITLEVAVDTFIEKHAATVAATKSATIDEVCAKYIYAKKSRLRPLAKKTLIGLKTTVNALVKCFGGRNIGTITRSDIEPALEEHWDNNSSRKDYLSRFRTFFKWAIVNKFITENPCGTADDIKVYAEKPDQLILDRDSLLTLLANALEEPAVLPFFALSLFAGLRENECKRIGWDSIYLDERKTIYVSKKVSKTFERNVPVHDTLIEWLQPCIGNDIDVTNHRRLFDGVRKGIPWQRDIMRHTAISYFMGKYNMIGQVAEWLGNSPAIIKKHYQVPVLKADVDWFWSLTPTKVKELIDERAKIKA